jgi:hypothetical protein
VRFLSAKVPGKSPLIRTERELAASTGPVIELVVGALRGPSNGSPIAKEALERIGAFFDIVHDVSGLHDLNLNRR